MALGVGFVTARGLRFSAGALALVVTWMFWAYAANQPRTQITAHSDVPIEGLAAAERVEFATGNVLFDAPAREHDGIGPLYVRTSCGSCHDEAMRGPGLVQKISDAGFGTSVRSLTAAGAKTPVLGASSSFRIGPPLVGRGFIEAIADGEIERMEREQSERGVQGRINRVVYGSEPGADERFDRHHKGEIVIGRFGLKARIGDLEEFVADALQGDMGMTSPLRPVELLNPDGIVDDEKPGIDVDAEGLRTRTAYVRYLAIPPRSTTHGAALFERVRCAACHVPALRTRDDYPVAAIAGREAAVYSDLLLHDMGGSLADGMSEGSAGPRDWRTAPLIGVRFMRQFLHDGRASSVTEAIEMHDGEAAGSVREFRALRDADRHLLVDFVGAL